MPFRKATRAGRGAEDTTFPSTRAPGCARAMPRVAPRGGIAIWMAGVGAAFWGTAAAARADEGPVPGPSIDAETTVVDGGGPAPGPAVAPEVPPLPASPPSPSPPAKVESVVVATRSRPRAAREDAAAASSVLLPAESPRARDDLGALLLEVPGANVTRQGGVGALTTVSLRGSNPDEVRIYVDGVPLNQAVGGAVDLSTLPLGDVERVEVYRGSTPIGFGESALGGVISVVTRTPGGPAWLDGRAGMGSFATFVADAKGGGAVGGLRLYIGLHALSAAGDFPDSPPAVPGGYRPPTRQNADLSQLDGVVRGAVSLPGRRELRLGLIGLWREQGLPAPNIYLATSARASASRALGHVDYESRDDLGRNSRLRVVAFASATRDEFSDPNHEIVGLPTATHDVTRSVGGTANAEKAVGSWGRLTTILEGRGEDFLPRNDFDAIAPVGHAATRLLGSAGAELDVRVSPLALDVIPSARLEASRDVRTGRDLLLGTQLPPGPAIEHLLPALRLGLVRSFGGDVTLRGNVGRYARLPSFVELYGYTRGVLGNPQLVPESGVNADLGVALAHRGAAAEWTAAVTAFGARVDDLIEWRTTATQTRAENIGRARIWGVEAETRLRTRRLALAGQATLTDARDESDVLANRGQQLVFHPRYRGYGRAEWSQPLAAGRWLAGVYADVDATAGNNRTPRLGAIPARAFVGAGISLAYAPSALRLVISAANLTDARTQDFQDYPLPGRSLFVTLGWSSVTTTAVPN